MNRETAMRPSLRRGSGAVALPTRGAILARCFRNPRVRVLGIDYGERRVGVAVSDPTGTLASPLATVERRRGKRPPISRLEELAREVGADRLVVGLPLDLDGNEDAWCAETRTVGTALAERLGVPVHFVDERMTSVIAERRVRGSGLPRAKREEKARVDAAAAAVILQLWLDRRKGAS